VLAQLDHELNRLPDKYRVPVVLCELEGRSRKEVARMLGVPEGTLSWRLAQAKKLLTRKLSRYGTVAVGALLAEGAATACLSPVLRASTAKTVLTAGAVPAKVLALTEGVLKAMLLTKLKITVCAGALMVLAGVGATGLTYRATAQQPKQGVALASRPQADDLEALRLEIEALRKSLQATRERVKALEEEVGVMKKQSGAPPRPRAPGSPAGPKMPPGGTRPGSSGPGGRPYPSAPPRFPSTELPAGPDSANPLAPTTNRAYPRSSTEPPTDPRSTKPDTSPPPGHNGPPPSTSEDSPKRPETVGDPLGDAQEALRKLRMNPDDKQAAEALERALKWLKEREKPRGPGETRKPASPPSPPAR
jgi:hypothetical protein